MILTPRQRLFLSNIRRTAAGRPGHRVACDPAAWLGRPLTRADRVKAHRTYGQLERRGLVQRHAWSDGSSRRFKTAALSLTPTGEVVAASLSMHAESAAAAPSGIVLTPSVPTSPLPAAPSTTTEETILSEVESRQPAGATFISEPAAVADPTPETPAPRGYVSVITGGSN